MADGKRYSLSPTLAAHYGIEPYTFTGSVDSPHGLQLEDGFSIPSDDEGRGRVYNEWVQQIIDTLFENLHAWNKAFYDASRKISVCDPAERVKERPVVIKRRLREERIRMWEQRHEDSRYGCTACVRECVQHLDLVIWVMTQGGTVKETEHFQEFRDMLLGPLLKAVYELECELEAAVKNPDTKKLRSHSEYVERAEEAIEQWDTEMEL